MQGRPSQALAGPPGWPDASAKASDDRGHSHGGTLPVIAPLFSYFTQLLGLSSLLPGRQLTRARSVGKGRSWAARGQTPHSRPAASRAPSCPPTRLGFRLPQTLPAATQQLVQLPHSGKQGAQPCSTPPPCHQCPYLGSRASPSSHCPPCAQGLCQNPQWRDRAGGDTEMEPLSQCFWEKGKRQTENSPLRCHV